MSNTAEALGTLHKGDRLPDGTFGVYEELSERTGQWVLAALSRYAYPPIDPATQRMTIVAPGETVAAQRPTLYWGPPTKPVTFENVNGGLRYNGLRIPFWLATFVLNDIYTK